MTHQETKTFMNKTNERCHTTGWRHMTDFEDELAFVRNPQAVQLAGSRYIVYSVISVSENIEYLVVINN